MPPWLPFALAASAVVALVAGARSGWRTNAELPPSPPLPPPKNGFRWP